MSASDYPGRTKSMGPPRIVAALIRAYELASRFGCKTACSRAGLFGVEYQQGRRRAVEMRPRSPRRRSGRWFKIWFRRQGPRAVGPWRPAASGLPPRGPMMAIDFSGPATRKVEGDDESKNQAPAATSNKRLPAILRSRRHYRWNWLSIVIEMLDGRAGRP